MEMILSEIDVEFVDLVTEFLESSKDIREAAELVNGDPIKQDMIKGITQEFLDVCARSEALRILVENSYGDNREYILSELREITELNRSISSQIRKKLIPLSWN
jgi:hypothetical protein